MAKRISGYQATDGSFFQKRAEADKHDLTLFRKARVEALVADSGAKVVDSTGADMPLREYLMKNADAILTALTFAKPTIKRPRKAKTEGAGLAAA
ncbi:hypothetical protein [Achromobacter sp. AGC39]